MRSNMFGYPFNNSSKKELMLDSLGSFVSYNQSQRMLQNFSKQRNCGRNGMKKSCQCFRPCACKPGQSSKGKGLKGIWNAYRGTIGNSRWTKKWCIEGGRELRGPFHGRKLSSCWDSARDCLGAGACHGRQHVRLRTRRCFRQFLLSSLSWAVILHPGPYWRNDPGACFISLWSKGEST